MTFVAKSAKFTSPSDATHWGGCFHENGLFIILHVTGNEPDQAENIDRSATSLELAAKRGKAILDDILSRSVDIKSWNLKSVESLLEPYKENSKVTAAVLGMLTSEGVLYLCSVGHGIVWMERGSKAGKILDSGASSSGIIKNGDRLLFISETFSHIFDHDLREQIFDSTDPDEAVETVATVILDKPEISGMSALFITISEGAEKKSVLDTFSVIKSSGKEKLAHYLRNIKNIFRGTESFETYEDVKSKRTLLTIAAVLVVLLLSSIFLNINHAVNTKKEENYTQVMDLVSHQYDEAVSLIDLNPTRSRELLSSSKLSLSGLLSQFPKNSKEYKDINSWLGKVSEEEMAAYKIYKLTDASPFYDLTLLKTGGNGSDIAEYKDTKAILDTSNKVVYTLVTSTKKGQIVAGPDTVKDAKTIDMHGNDIYILNSDGVVQVDSQSSNARVIIKHDDKWGNIVSMAAFGGNIYLLDVTHNTIWKYIATDTGFSPIVSYLNSDTKIDLSGSTKMVIDGSVWVLTADNLLKFTGGQITPFAFSGISDKIENIASVSTGDDQQNIYLLDKSLSRIMVFDKTGVYQSQYQWDGFKDASDLVVSEQEKKIFVLISSKIYAIDIK